MLAVTPDQLAALEATLDSHSVDRAPGLRAAIILKCAVESSEAAVSELLEVKPAQVRKWRQRWEEAGLAGLRVRRPRRRLDPARVRAVFALRGTIDRATGKRYTIDAIADRVTLPRQVVFKLLQERRQRLDLAQRPLDSSPCRA